MKVAAHPHYWPIGQAGLQECFESLDNYESHLQMHNGRPIPTFRSCIFEQTPGFPNRPGKLAQDGVWNPAPFGLLSPSLDQSFLPNGRIVPETIRCKSDDPLACVPGEWNAHLLCANEDATPPASDPEKSQPSFH